MYISHKEKSTEEINVIDKLICDCCGEEIPKISENLSNFFWEYVDLQTDWGYYCNIFCDGENHEIKVCEKCYADWISNFKYAPKGFGHECPNVNLDDIQKSDQELFEEWKIRYKNKSK